MINMEFTSLDIQRRLVYPDKLQAFCADTLRPEPPDYKDDMFEIVEVFLKRQIEEILALSPIVVVAMLSETFELENTRSEFEAANVEPSCLCLVIHKNTVYAVRRALDEGLGEMFVWNTVSVRDDLIATDGNVAIYGPPNTAIKLPKIVFPIWKVSQEPDSAKNWTRVGASIAAMQLRPPAIRVDGDAQTAVLRQESPMFQRDVSAEIFELRRVTIFFPIEFSELPPTPKVWANPRVGIAAEYLRKEIDVATILSQYYGFKSEPLDLEPTITEYAMLADLKHEYGERPVIRGVLATKYMVRNDYLVRKTRILRGGFTMFWKTNYNQTFVLYELRNGLFDSILTESWMYYCLQEIPEFDESVDDRYRSLSTSWQQKYGIYKQAFFQMKFDPTIKKYPIVLGSGMIGGKTLYVSRFTCPQIIQSDVPEDTANGFWSGDCFEFRLKPRRYPYPSFGRYAEREWEVSFVYWEFANKISYYLATHSFAYEKGFLYGIMIDTKIGNCKVHAFGRDDEIISQQLSDMNNQDERRAERRYDIPGKFVSYYFLESVFKHMFVRNGQVFIRKEFFQISPFTNEYRDNQFKEIAAKHSRFDVKFK